MKVTINTDVDIDANDIAKVMSIGELASLITELANKIVTQKPEMSYATRRAIACDVADNLSENGVKLLAEILAAAYTSELVKDKKL